MMHLFKKEERDISLQGRGKKKERRKKEQKSIAVNKTSGEKALKGMTIPPKRVCMSELAAMIVFWPKEMTTLCKTKDKTKEETPSWRTYIQSLSKVYVQ